MRRQTISSTGNADLVATTSRGARLGRLAAALAVVAMLLGMIPSGARAQDAEDWVAPTTVYVQTTGHTVSEPFLDMWRRYQRYLGDPLTEPVKRKLDVPGVDLKTRTVQYFRNAVLVQTKDDPRGDRWDVQALPLGEAALDLDRDEIPAAALTTKGTCTGLGSGDCRRFDETKHTLRWGFKTYWEDNGGTQIIGMPITEEFKTEDGLSVQYFERGVLRWTEKRDVHPVANGRRFIKLETSIRQTKIKRPSDVPVYEDSIFEPPVAEDVQEVEDGEELEGVGGQSGPGPQQGAYKEIVVSISQQYLWAYEGDSVVVETYVSTGTAEVIETTTPVGYWAVNTKVDVQDMEGTISGEYYFVEDVPYVMYFDGLGNALHGTYWHSNFGSPMSHGCVNLPMDVAAIIYAWAEVGTAVTVI